MRRVQCEPRAGWERIVERQGLVYHHWNDEGVLRKYWEESAYYEFTRDEIQQVEAATDELHRLCLEAVEHVVSHRRYPELAIPEWLWEHIEASWRAQPPSLYGRFDLCYDGENPPKMLEYNADTPTSLLEAAVIQWQWADEVHPGADQFNAIHDQLVSTWKSMADDLPGDILHVAHCAGDAYGEDYLTTVYLQDTAEQAGIRTRGMRIEDVGFDHERGVFTDAAGDPITAAFKLYPWEWMIHEEYGEEVFADPAPTTWIEPAWKMILSNKGILPLLWELNPGHPNLLPARLESPEGMTRYVRKPLLAREGANITIVEDGRELAASSGEYGEEGWVYQEFSPLPSFTDGASHTVIGSWVIGGKSCGLGIRESGLVTDVHSLFLPHIIAPSPTSTPRRKQ